MQISWASYLASTGINEIDYIFGDPHVTPLADQKKYTEKIWQFKNIWCCLSVKDLNSLLFNILIVLETIINIFLRITTTNDDLSSSSLMSLQQS